MPNLGDRTHRGELSHPAGVPEEGVRPGARAGRQSDIVNPDPPPPPETEKGRSKGQVGGKMEEERTNK